MGRRAFLGCAASAVCISLGGIIGGGLAGCGLPGAEAILPLRPSPNGTGPLVFEAPAPAGPEEPCAWYGDAREGVLYFGESAFWDAFRAAGGDPEADLAHEGPQRIGRFDLRELGFLSPLVVASEAPGGTWDVLAHPNGRVYFTTFFGSAGFVDPGTGAVTRFDTAGPGLNELARLPDGRLLATRYARSDRGGGSIVLLTADGRLEAEYDLLAEPGWRVAPKSVAFDPVREEIWVTTDLLHEEEAPRHDARVLRLTDGALRLRVEEPEIQFVAFTAAGSGAIVEREGERLFLRRRAAGTTRDPARSRERLLLDAEFPAASDFAQEARFAADGSVVVTRWSGRVHRVDAAGRVRHLDLPRLATDGLYYSAVLDGARLCATYCAGITVVCLPAR